MDQITVNIPRGPLGIQICSTVSGRCAVVRLLKPNSFLRVGDIIDSLNGQSLQGKSYHFWTSQFGKTAKMTTRTLRLSHPHQGRSGSRNTTTHLSPGIN